MDQRVASEVSPEISPDTVVRQLIAGVDTDDIVVYDVSDSQLYGRKRYRRLTGELALAAEAAGCRAEVYQSVYWLTLVYFPVKPLGVYLVLPRQTCDDPDGDAEQYRAVKIPMDWRQIAVHFAIAFSLVLGAVGGVVACSQGGSKPNQPLQQTGMAVQVGQLDLQSLAAQSVGVLIESPSSITGKLP